MSHQAGAEVKQHGRDNDLIDRIRKTEFFAPIVGELDSLLKAETFTGRAPEQVEAFYEREVRKALKTYEERGVLKTQETDELKV